MTTDDLIDRLTKDIRPLKPLRHPVRRGMEWFAGTTVFLAALITMKAMVSNTPLAGLSMSLVVPQLAAIVTSVTAAAAAFVSVVPGMSRRVLAWPVVAAAVWMVSLLPGGYSEGRVVDAQVATASEWPCVFMIAAGSLLPVMGLTRLLRRGAPLSPRISLALGSLSAAGAANIGACLSQPHTSNGVLLAWHGATVLVVIAAGALAGRAALAWPRPGIS